MTYKRFKISDGSAVTLADPALVPGLGGYDVVRGATADGPALSIPWHAVVAYVNVDGFNELEPDLAWVAV